MELILAQKLKSFLENPESLIKTAKETYTHQLKVLHFIYLFIYLFIYSLSIL